jgi:hypothetical protein
VRGEIDVFALAAHGFSALIDDILDALLTQDPPEGGERFTRKKQRRVLFARQKDRRH